MNLQVCRGPHFISGRSKGVLGHVGGPGLPAQAAIQGRQLETPTGSRQLVDQSADAVRGHGGRSRWSDQHRSTKLPANETGPLRLFALEHQPFANEGEKHLLAGTEVEGLAESLGYDQLHLGRN